MKKGSFALRLFLYASLVSLVWLGSYVLLSGVFEVKEQMTDVPQTTVTPEAVLPTPLAIQWSVLVVKDSEGEVSDFFLRYADFLSDTLVFVEVPTDTKAELASGGYEVLKVHNPELPELFMVSDLCRIFSEETWCLAAEEVGVALLGVRPKECYVIEKELFDGMTETVDGQRRFLSGMSVKDTISAAVRQSVTNDTLRDELVYLESYLDLDEIYYRVLPGEALAEEYRPDFGGIQQMSADLQSGRFLPVTE